MRELWMIFGAAALVIAVALGMSIVADVSDEDDLSLGDIVDQLPLGAMLRDLAPIPGTQKALVIYILNPDIDDAGPLDDYVLTCPGRVNGQAIRGEYHLSLVEDGRIVNDVRIPGDRFHGDIPVQRGIAYRQLASILNHETAMDNVRNGTAQLVEVKLLKLRDLNGDGRPREFDLRVYIAACGHVQVLIAGYSERQNRAIVYPVLEAGEAPDYWHDNFFPDKNGTVRWRLACGDHGSRYGMRKTFAFDAERGAYVLTQHSTNECGF